METLNYIPKKTLAVFILTLLFTLNGLKGDAQAITGRNKATSDTITYELYGSGANFNHHRTIIFTDKASVDSLANLLATRAGKRYRIIYQKQGEVARVISADDLKNIDKSGIFQITIAHNKRGTSPDSRPMYLLSSR
jgi:hypothetical protein